MRIVLDANLVVALFLPLPYSQQVWGHLTTWRRNQAEFLAPTLLQYEVNATLHRSLSTGLARQYEAKTALEEMQTLRVRYLPPSPEMHTRAWYWADRLTQSKTYDAQYLALAELERADFWTADQRLVNSARQAGIGWVHWIGESERGSL